MRVTITKFRQDLFRLVDRAMQGQPLQFTHKGVVFTVSAETKSSRLARLTGQTVVAPGADLGQARRRLLEEMESEWERDWSEL